MCAGPELTLLTAGTGAQMYGQQQRADAMQSAADDEFMQLQNRQQTINENRDASLSEMLQETAGRDNVESRQAERRTKLEGAFEEADPGSGDYDPSAAGPDEDSTAAKVVQQNRESAQSEAGSVLEQENQALAELQSMGDAFEQLQIQRQPKLQRIENLQARSGRLNQMGPSWIRGAAQAESDEGQAARALGQVMSGVGMRGMQKAGFEAGKGGAGGGFNPFDPSARTTTQSGLTA